MADANISAIGKYRIIELVGEGAMGVVYRAHDSVLDRNVAIKVMNESIARQDDLRKRFLHEAQAAASLQHPNVVCIYDLGEADGHLFIAMEFIQGVDLEHLIELAQPLSLQTKLDIIIDVLTGLAFAHKRGIVHRDIKPANIRVAEDGRAKIMDFGVAHLASSSMTSTGSILGTPTYMAPEQITEGKTSPATDIFAVGGVLYQILTMMKPFEAPTLQNLFFKIITEEPRNVSELTPGLPAALDRIVRKAMAKEPGDRYTSALEMANELTNVRSKLSGPSYPASVSLSASVASAIEMSRTHSRKRARTLAFAGGGALAAAALFAIAWAKSGSPKVADDKPAAVATPALTQPQSVPAGVPAATVNTASETAPIVQPPPSPARAKVQEKKPASTRDSRSATATKAISKPVQSKVVTTAAPARVDPPVTTVNPRQDQLPSPPPAVVVAKPATQPPPQESTPPIAAPPTAADIAPAVEAFARAIESKDIGAIRRVYPGLTSDQQRRFEQFFDGARTINASFRVANISASSASAAEAQLAGVYEFVTVAGKTERQPVSFAVSLRQEGRTWRLTSLR
ncbi:MAG TPA: protein kinase [Gemmatimonadaceae bacterium]|nr:protein kinase [Gemmatimonadaceae bacterium]